MTTQCVYYVLGEPLPPPSFSRRQVRLVLPPEHADRVLNAKQNRPYVAVVALTVLVAQIRSKIPVRAIGA